MLLVLHGAKRNVGDFLIRERALALLRLYLPDHEIVTVPRWEELSIDQVGAARAVVLAGGPGLAAHFYPRVFPLVPDLGSESTPILPLALGWSGRPTGPAGHFEFDQPSLAALRHIHRNIGWSSVRDLRSEQIVTRAGVGPTEMSGCVAWYDLTRMGRAVEPPTTIADLVVTTPASILLAPQCGALLRSLAERFPGARRRCVFHRGIQHGPDSKRASALGHRYLALAARRSGWELVDAAADLEAIAFYARADLHVGYRVHAHLAFLSARRPSILLEEDGRGAGQAATLHPGFRLGVGGDAVAEALRAVDAELAGGFPRLRAAVAKIEVTAPVMRATIEQLR